MLFLPEATLQSVNKLQRRFKDEGGDSVPILEQVLNLDPNDDVVLIVLARLRKVSDPKGAEELLWRAIRAMPCVYTGYLHLAQLLADQEPLSKGLVELACRKILWDEVPLDEMEEALPEFDWEGVPDFENLETEEKLHSLADWLRAQRDGEPPAVTEVLRPLRLAQQIQDADVLERNQVDAVVQEGATMVPLLIGMLRGWVRNIIPEDDFSIVENSLALLGEIGDPSALPYLVEMTPMEDPSIAGTCLWAIHRIVEQNPGKAVEVMENIAPGLDGPERMVLMECLTRLPGMASQTNLLERLFQNFEKVDKKVRERCFKVMAATVVAMKGREGVEMVQGFLRSYGGALSRNALRDCGQMVKELAEMTGDRSSSIAPSGPSPWTIYQICAGEVDWEEEQRKSEETEEEEDEYNPQPISRKATPGRNDSCWCGSGKKYKKCHLESDEAQGGKSGARAVTPEQDLDQFDPLRRNVGELLQTLPAKESKAAMVEFFGSGGTADEMAFATFIDWMIHDRVSQTFHRSVMEEYAARHASELTEQERSFLETSAASYVDLLEIQEIQEGKGAEVKSLTSGETFFVHDVSLSKALVRWDGVHGRIIHGTRGLELSGTVVQIPRMHLEALRSWMEQRRKASGLEWPAYLKQNWPGIRQQGVKIGEEWMSSLRLQNTSGEEMVVSTARYDVVNPGALIAGLRSSAVIDEAEETSAFVWLDGPAGEGGHTVLGHFRIAGNKLTLECNSRQRLKRGKAMLADLAGASVAFRGDEFSSSKDLMQQIKENPRREKEKSDIPAEVQAQVVGEYMERHYAQWPDMKLPALDGKTPRQAVRNAAGKRKVAQLLKDFENTEARKRKAGEYAYDISRLRAELGIKD